MPAADPTPAAMSLDDLTAAILEATHQLNSWEQRRRDLLSELETRHDLGQVPDKFQHNGYGFSWSPGRRSYVWPDSVLDLQAAVKQAQETAIATGAAVEKPSTPYWTVKQGKGG